MHLDVHSRRISRGSALCLCMCTICGFIPALHPCSLYTTNAVLCAVVEGALLVSRTLSVFNQSPPFDITLLDSVCFTIHIISESKNDALTSNRAFRLWLKWAASQVSVHLLL